MPISMTKSKKVGRLQWSPPSNRVVDTKYFIHFSYVFAIKIIWYKSWTIIFIFSRTTSIHFQQTRPPHHVRHAKHPCNEVMLWMGSLYETEP